MTDRWNLDRLRDELAHASTRRFVRTAIYVLFAAFGIVAAIRARVWWLVLLLAVVLLMDGTQLAAMIVLRRRDRDESND